MKPKFNPKDFLSLEALKKKIKLKILLFIAPYALAILGIFAGVLLIVLVAVGPIMNALSGLQNMGSGGGGQYNEIGESDIWGALDDNQEDFLAALDSQYTSYGEKGIELNTALIISTITYPFSVEYDPKVADCMGKTAENNSKNADCEKYQGGKIDRISKLAEQMVSKVEIPKPTKDNPNATITAYFLDYDKYDNYLKTDYIINSPEFSFPTALMGAEREARLNNIVTDIHGRTEAIASWLAQRKANTAYGTIPDSAIKLLKIPVQSNYDIINCFGYVVSNGNASFHIGIDVVPAKDDINITAVADGIVTIVKSNSPGKCSPNCAAGEDTGNYIEIYHKLDQSTYTYSTRYLHLATISDAILNGTQTTDGDKTGILVKQGDIIGTMGDTGDADKPNLEFQFYKGDTPLNPGNLFTNPQNITGDNCQVYDTGTGGGSADWACPFYSKGRCNPKNKAKVYAMAKIAGTYDDTTTKNEMRKKVIDTAIPLYLKVKYCSGKLSYFAFNGCSCDGRMKDTNPTHVAYCTAHPYSSSSVYAGAANYYGKIGMNPLWSTGKVGLDCGGFVTWVYRQVYNYGVYGVGMDGACNTKNGGNTRITDVMDLKPGDLLCRQRTAQDSSEHHIAMLLGYEDIGGQRLFYTLESLSQETGVVNRVLTKAQITKDFNNFYEPGIISNPSLRK